jgi:hypothetical protein
MTATGLNENDDISEIGSRVGVWGTIAAGKTAFVASLYHAMHTDKWRIFAANSDTSEFVLEMTDVIYNQRRFPAASPPDVINVYEFELYYHIPDPASDETNTKYRLRFIDAPASDYHDRERSVSSGTPLDCFESCGTIVCLFDVEPSLDRRASTDDLPVRCFDQIRQFTNLLVFLRSRDRALEAGRITSYRFALCVGKCDLPEV